MVVAHQDVNPRFDRYCLTAGYNAVINQRQFRIPGLQWPTDYRRPDTTYVDRHDLVVGGLAVELHHARGETDDHTWVWVPERRTLCTGDLFIWCTPNAGNPQKVQRYARDWAVALRVMADLGRRAAAPRPWPAHRRCRRRCGRRSSTPPTCSTASSTRRSR